MSFNIVNAIKQGYGELDKKYALGMLPGGAERTDTVKKIMSAPEAVMITAQEAVPAIVGGALGIDRSDANINPKLRQALKETAEQAYKEGRSKFGYMDYDSTTPGGLAARLTMGDVSMDEVAFDDKGNLIGMSQKFDTDKTPMEALGEFNPLNLKTYYKPAEAALAAVQDRGLTTHNIDFLSPRTGAPSASDMMSGILTPTPGRMAGEVDITVDNTAPPGPATNYAVQAGDTLSSIAAANNISVNELVRKNQIANPNLISIGQTLNF
jgi:LysM repeat protein|tara:strand:- start:214 stop:1014 length:801 start_codon:yes stop_codon:yes gene_type:complete